MGEAKSRLNEAYVTLGAALAAIMQQVADGAVVMGGDLMDGSTVFVTRHPGIVEVVKQLGYPQKLEADKLPAVEGGFMLRTLAQFDVACRTRIAEEQEKPNSDTALIALLCDAVRLTRELQTATQKGLIVLP